jgi:chaperonin GroEL
MLLTTETLIVEKPAEEEETAGAGHGHGHGH